MMKIFRVALALTSLVIALGSVSAATAQSTLDYRSGVPTNGRRVEPGLSAGQSFTVPADQTRITSVALNVASLGGPANTFRLSLHTITGNVVGPEIAGDQFSNTPAYPSTSLTTLAPAGGVPVTPGLQYIALATYVSGDTSSVNYIDPSRYAGGIVYQFGNGPDFPSQDAFFLVQFAAPTPVPTMSEWAMILLGLSLAGGAALHIQRRRYTV